MQELSVQCKGRLIFEAGSANMNNIPLLPSQNCSNCDVAATADRRCVCWLQGVDMMNMEVQPQPLTPSFFFNRTKDISPSVSAAIYSTFEKSGLLDSSGFLLEDPR